MPPPKNSPAVTTPRVPPEACGIQVNFCKNPKCTNFGVPACSHTTRGRNANGDNYLRVSAGRPGSPLMRCKLCGEIFPLKSNLGIAEEVVRLSSYLVAKTHCCPQETCANHNVPISTPKQYQSFGTTAAGSARYRCKACGLHFSVAQKAVPVAGVQGSNLDNSRASERYRQGVTGTWCRVHPASEGRRSRHRRSDADSWICVQRRDVASTDCHPAYQEAGELCGTMTAGGP